MKHKITPPFVFFVFCLIANTTFWSFSYKVKSSWANVPPVPAKEKASLLTIGDKELAYRSYAMVLQNLGNTGGRFESLNDYNYKLLSDWFFLEDSLNPESNAVPMLAATYFGAASDTDQLVELLDYLAVVGARPDGEKWRWLGHAVFLAKHVLKDNKKALELAYKLAANKSPDLADWAKQMPVFILQEEGQTELAYKIMMNILISNVDAMHPNEINYMKDYICNTLVVEMNNVEAPEFCGEIKI